MKPGTDSEPGTGGKSARTAAGSAGIADSGAAPVEPGADAAGVDAEPGAGAGAEALAWAETASWDDTPASRGGQLASEATGSPCRSLVRKSRLHP